MKKLIDITGQTFNRLTVISSVKKDGGKTYWNCLCSCGNNVCTTAYKMKNGLTKSCGCHRQDMRTKHGLSKSPEYRSWLAMMSRCYKTGNASFEKYGGRGIGVCEKWHDFVKFLVDMGVRPANHSIERMDNDKDYCASNCKWASPLEQVHNRKITIWIDHLDRTQTLMQWTRELGIVSYATALKRIRRGWPPTDAITQPVR